MRAIFGLILVILVGAGIWYFLRPNEAPRDFDRAREAVKDSAAQVQKLDFDLDLNTDRLKTELEKTGRVVRKKAESVGAKIADATVDARATAAIKTKFAREPNLSSMSISVNTTEGVVTLSGLVSSHEQIKRALEIALETEGVKEVISTLQVKSP